MSPFFLQNGQNSKCHHFGIPPKIEKFKDAFYFRCVLFQVSDINSSYTRGPILMKLWGCIELTLNCCNVNFSSTFRFRPQTGSELFFKNRKLNVSEPEVENDLNEKRT